MMDDPELHVSDLRWDRLLAGELALVERDAALGHAASCPACAARLSALTAEAEVFAGRADSVLPRRTFERTGPRRAPSRFAWARWSMGALAAAAALVLVVRARPERGPGERAKGNAPRLLIAAGPEGRLVPVASGDLLHPGDYVQAAYTAPEGGYGAVLSRDGSGKAMAYVPAQGDEMVALPAGTLRSFPQATVMDGVVGQETLVVLWCAARRSLAPLVAELAATGSVVAPQGCAAQRVVLDKRAVTP